MTHDRSKSFPMIVRGGNPAIVTVLVPDSYPITCVQCNRTMSAGNERRHPHKCKVTP